MSRLVTQPRAHDYCDNGVDTRNVDVYVDVDVDWQYRAGFHLTGPRSGSLGVSFVLADWQVKVFWSYSLVDIPSERLCVHTINISGYMRRRSRYIWDSL